MTSKIQVLEIRTDAINFNNAEIKVLKMANKILLKKGYHIPFIMKKKR